MKNLIASTAIIALSACTSVTPQVGYRNARGYEAGTGYQLGAGLRVTKDVGPVSLEASAMGWADQGGKTDQFVNRGTNDIESEVTQFSLGVRLPIAKGDGWEVTFGAGAAYQEAKIDIDLSYAGTLRDSADEWTGYGELAYHRDSGLMMSLRVDEPFDCGAQSVYSTTPGGRGVALLLGFNFGN